MKKLILGVVLIIVVFVYIVITSRIDRSRMQEFYNHIDTSNILGELESVRIAYHGSAFKMREIEEEFVFYPNSIDRNKRILFHSIAEVGDTIIKKAHSDTLKLKKLNGDIYLFRFSK